MVFHEAQGHAQGYGNHKKPQRYRGIHRDTDTGVTTGIQGHPQGYGDTNRDPDEPTGNTEITEAPTGVTAT